MPFLRRITLNRTCLNIIINRLKLIKKNLKSLGINHDNFVSEKQLVKNQEVEKVIDFLQKNNKFL